MSNTDKPSRNERSQRDLAFFIAFGLAQGATVFAFATVPQSQASALVFPATFWLFLLFSRLYRRFGASPSPRRMSGATIVYLVAVVVLPIGAGAVGWVVIRNGDGPLWLAWTIVALVIAVAASGALIVGERSTDERASTP